MSADGLRLRPAVCRKYKLPDLIQDRSLLVALDRLDQEKRERKREKMESAAAPEPDKKKTKQSSPKEGAAAEKTPPRRKAKRRLPTTPAESVMVARNVESGRGLIS